MCGLKELGQRIRLQRRRLGLTLVEAAARSGISKPYLSLIETGQVDNPPSDAKLQGLEKTLSFPPGDLVLEAHLIRTPQDVRQMLDSLLAATGQGQQLTAEAIMIRQRNAAASSARPSAATLSYGQLRAGNSFAATGTAGSVVRGPASRGGITPSSGSPGPMTHSPGGRSPAAHRAVSPGMMSRGGISPGVSRSDSQGDPIPSQGGSALAVMPTETEPAEGFAARFAAVVPARRPVMRSTSSRLIPLIHCNSGSYPRAGANFDPERAASESIDCPFVADPDAFALEIDDPAMSDKYSKGDIIVFSPGTQWASGDDCFVRLRNGQATFRRVYLERDSIGQPRLKLQPLSGSRPAHYLLQVDVCGCDKAIYRYHRLEE